jgi:pyrimidine deaminase RibD-like protein
MIIQEILTAPSNDPQEELDTILAKCCEAVLDGQDADSEFYGMVGACVVCPDGQLVYGVNYQAEDGRRVHAERAALERCDNVTPECIIVTTLSPCNRPMDERSGESCEDLIAEYGIEHVYSGYKDPTQEGDDSIETRNEKLRELCKQLADTFLKENFADGRVKGKSRPGRVKKSGASCKGSVTDLRARAKRASGEKAKMYHWCANMKSGRKK